MTSKSYFFGIPRYFLVSVLIVSSSAKFCDRNPKLLQCRALKLQNVSPRYDGCRLVKNHKNKCKTGDLVHRSVAGCMGRIPGNTQHSLVSGFKLGSSTRCFPNVKSPSTMHLRNVAPSFGKFRCVPEQNKPVICGEGGTRCVCDAPAPSSDISWLRNTCRCQYFIDLCDIANVCQHKHAKCRTWGSELQCSCHGQPTPCNRGVNQCTGNPTLCEDEGKFCLELDDQNRGWTLGSEIEGRGYTCVAKDVAEQLRSRTLYCHMNLPTLGKMKRVHKVKPKNEMDMCCYRTLTCAGGQTSQGTIFSSRPCYCFVEFRKCLLQASEEAAYKPLVREVVKVLNAIKQCQMDNGDKCNPSHPSTCRKGDLIHPSTAHCKIDCRTGPLLPIWERACSKRQCKPPHYTAGSLVVDAPNSDESSVCKPVKGLPVECGQRGTHTRCVCEANPKITRFTDRCRCQFWPSRWEEFLTTPPPNKIREEV